MKILHTADWHLGQSLYGKKRYCEINNFLNWLLDVINDKNIDVLLVAGDIFDSTTPTNRAQQIYYNFLSRVAKSCCKHVVIIGGNHDSPSLLDATCNLLDELNIHVVGGCRDNIEDEVFVLKNSNGVAQLIVCAVPYLRDRDLRIVRAGESIEDKAQKLLTGISEHYIKIAAIAAKKRAMIGNNIPIIGMGHLFTAGGQTDIGDGVRELYIGTLAHITANCFPQEFDYLALGHLHRAQKVDNRDDIFYSGSPLPMSFAENNQQKSICQLEFTNGKLNKNLIAVPLFQKLASIHGSWQTIENSITKLIAENVSYWLEIIYEDAELIDNLRERIATMIAETKIEVLCIKNRRVTTAILQQQNIQENLNNISNEDVFKRCLDANEIIPEQREQLIAAYNEILTEIFECDSNDY